MEKMFNQSPGYKSCLEGNADIPSIPYHSIPAYSEKEAEALEEKLDKKETFIKALQVLITWLNRGECKENNAARFCHLVQLGSDHFNKLQTDRKKNLKETINELEELFHAIEKENIPKYFTPDQKKRIQEMKANVLYVKENISIGESKNDQEVEGQKITLQTKVGSLTHKLNAAKKLKVSLRNEFIEKENEILKLKSELKKSPEGGRNCEEENNDDNEVLIIISLLSAFLFKYPEGVNIETIVSNINNSQTIIPKISSIKMEEIMRSHPKIFEEAKEEECLPIEVTRERKWKCKVLEWKSFPHEP